MRSRGLALQMICDELGAERTPCREAVRRGVRRRCAPCSDSGNSRARCGPVSCSSGSKIARLPHAVPRRRLGPREPLSAATLAADALLGVEPSSLDEQRIGSAMTRAVVFLAPGPPVWLLTARPEGAITRLSAVAWGRCIGPAITTSYLERKERRA